MWHYRKSGRKDVCCTTEDKAPAPACGLSLFPSRQTCSLKPSASVTRQLWESEAGMQTSTVNSWDKQRDAERQCLIGTRTPSPWLAAETPCTTATSQERTGEVLRGRLPESLPPTKPACQGSSARGPNTEMRHLAWMHEKNLYDAKMQCHAHAEISRSAFWRSPGPTGPMRSCLASQDEAPASNKRWLSSATPQGGGLCLRRTLPSPFQTEQHH